MKWFIVNIMIYVNVYDILILKNFYRIGKWLCMLFCCFIFDYCFLICLIVFFLIVFFLYKEKGDKISFSS